MTKSSRYLAILVWGLVMLLSTDPRTVLANEGCGGMGMMGGRMREGHDQNKKDEDASHELTHLLKHRKEIGLTSEQISKLKAMQLDLSRTRARAEADIKVAKLELDALADDERADLTAIQAKVDQIKKAEGELLIMAIKSRRDAMAMLTPEQREKDDALRKEMMEKMMGREDRHDSGMDGMRGGGRKGRSQAGKTERGGKARGEAAGKTGGAEHQH